MTGKHAILKALPSETVVMHDCVTGVVVINFELLLFGAGYEAGGWNDDEGGLLVDGSAEGLLRYPKEVLLRNSSFYESHE